MWCALVVVDERADGYEYNLGRGSRNNAYVCIWVFAVRGWIHHRIDEFFCRDRGKRGGERKKNHRGPVLITRIVALPYLPGSLPLFRNGIVPLLLFFFKSLTKILSSGIRRSNGWIR